MWETKKGNKMWLLSDLRRSTPSGRFEHRKWEASHWPGGEKLQTKEKHAEVWGRRPSVILKEQLDEQYNWIR